jgi:N-acetylglucosamine-6-phosphate deacetylase
LRYGASPIVLQIHNHGLGGAADVQEYWLNPEYTLSRLPTFGTTSLLPTLTFPAGQSNFADICQTLRRCSAPENKFTWGTVIEGVNAEGPIVADHGGLPGEHVGEMSDAEFIVLLDSIPHLRLMTISPHREAAVNYSRLRLLLARGVVPALGHDKQASAAEILGAMRCSPAQPLHTTHCFNVMTLHHRSMGLANFGLVASFPNMPEYQVRRWLSARPSGPLWVTCFG